MELQIIRLFFYVFIVVTVILFLYTTAIAIMSYLIYKRLKEMMYSYKDQLKNNKSNTIEYSSEDNFNSMEW